MIVLGDDGFYAVVARGEQPPILARTRSAGCPLGREVFGVPDAIVHISAVAINERHFLGRIQLRNSADTRANEEPEVLMRRAVHVGLEKRRMLGIVNRCEHVGVHVVDCFPLEQRLG